MSDQLLTPAHELAALRKPAFPNESTQYADARRALLAEEIEVRRHMTRLSEQRQPLPLGPEITKNYRFRDEHGADVGLLDLFGAHRTLITYFWMYGPERSRPCPMCTNWLGGVDGNAQDVKQHAALMIIGRSTVERQRAFATERGWRGLNFVQTLGDEYAQDLGGLNEKGGENPLLTVYHKHGEKLHLFYGAEMPLEAADPGQDPRGHVDIAPLWNLLDLTPDGRGSHWYPKLDY